MNSTQFTEQDRTYLVVQYILFLDTYRTNSIGCKNVIAVCDRCTSSLDWPNRLRQTIDGSVRIEYDFSTIQTVHKPVQRMVSTIADIDCNLTVLGIEHWMS